MKGFKKVKVVVVILMMAIMIQCQKNLSDLTIITDDTDLKLSRAALAYENALEQLNNNESSDSFVINSVIIDDALLIMFIEVAYNVGYQAHQFSLIYNYDISS